jgi:hypothetical protein
MDALILKKAGLLGLAGTAVLWIGFQMVQRTTERIYKEIMEEQRENEEKNRQEKENEDREKRKKRLGVSRKKRFASDDIFKVEGSTGDNAEELKANSNSQRKAPLLVTPHFLSYEEEASSQEEQNLEENPDEKLFFYTMRLFS